MARMHEMLPIEEPGVVLCNQRYCFSYSVCDVVARRFTGPQRCESVWSIDSLYDMI